MLGTLLGLLAAAAFGVSDFVAGVASRRVHFLLVAVLAQVVGALVMIVAVLLTQRHLAGTAAVLWGALSGIGSATGSLALYRGFSLGQMSVAAPLSAVGSAALPAIVGIALGDRLSALGIFGVLVALPAIWLVSKAPGGSSGSLRAGTLDGLAAGGGFALLFICLNRAGNESGLWPVAVGQWTSLLFLGIAVAVSRPAWTGRIRPVGLPIFAGGALGVAATVLFFYASHVGMLTIAAVLASIYPGFTVVLAAIALRERPSRGQLAGLGLCALAIVAIIA